MVCQLHYVLLRCVAQVGQDVFAPYYPSFMPGVIGILGSARGPAYSQHRGKAMECIGLLGEAVGEAVFAPDALTVMQLLLTALVRPQ